jgi:Uma2 family endonuclease
MIAVPKRRAQYQDLADLPEGTIGEIIDGELFTQPRPAVPHARAGTSLGTLLQGPFDFGRGGPGGWVLLIEPEVHFGPEPEVLVPDLAGWRRERMPQIPRTPAIALVPDWVCEILSPSTEAKDRTKKLPLYRREGVRHVWLLDPEVETLEVYRHGAEGWVLIATHHQRGAVRAEPFEAIELDLGLVFSR